MQSYGLNFSGTGARVVVSGNCGGTSPTSGTQWAWVRYTPLAATSFIISKSTSGGLGFWTLQIAGTASRVRALMDFATTDADAQSVDGTLVAGVTYFIASTHDGVAAPKIYVGTSTLPATEVAYATSTAPSGARVSDSGGATSIGNNETGGRSASTSVIWQAGQVSGYVATLAQVQAIQSGRIPPIVTGGWWTLGPSGAGTVWDRSGNGFHGTPTAALVVPTPWRQPADGQRLPQWYVRAAPIAAGGFFARYYYDQPMAVGI